MSFVMKISKEFPLTEDQAYILFKLSGYKEDKVKEVCRRMVQDGLSFAQARGLLLFNKV